MEQIEKVRTVLEKLLTLLQSTSVARDRFASVSINLGGNTDGHAKQQGNLAGRSGHPGRHRIDGGPNTIGIVLLAFLAGRTDGIPEATSTPTLRRVSAAAMSGSCAALCAKPELDDDFLPFDVAQFAQSLPESGIGTSATSWSLRGDDRAYL